MASIPRTPLSGSAKDELNRLLESAATDAAFRQQFFTYAAQVPGFHAAMNKLLAVGGSIQYYPKTDLDAPDGAKTVFPSNQPPIIYLSFMPGAGENPVMVDDTLAPGRWVTVTNSGKLLGKLVHETSHILSAADGNPTFITHQAMDQSGRKVEIRNDYTTRVRTLGAFVTEGRAVLAELNAAIAVSKATDGQYTLPVAGIVSPDALLQAAKLPPDQARNILAREYAIDPRPDSPVGFRGYAQIFAPDNDLGNLQLPIDVANYTDIQCDFAAKDNGDHRFTIIYPDRRIMWAYAASDKSLTEEITAASGISRVVFHGQANGFEIEGHHTQPTMPLRTAPPSSRPAANP